MHLDGGLTKEDAALLRLGHELKLAGYTFTTITPDTHARINRRPENSLAASVEDILGWSRPFRPGPPFDRLAAALSEAGALEVQEDLLKSRVRFSSIGRHLFVHSAFPTTAPDSVFFGPDTYRFVRALRAFAKTVPARRFKTIVDVGAGSGAAGIVLADLLKPERVILSDVNSLALRYGEINVRLAALDNCTTRSSDVMARIDENVDLIVANPPYLQDASGRRYRHGGENLGIDLSLRIVREGLSRLPAGGHLILYTGAPSVGGKDVFWSALEPYVDTQRFAVQYDEIDPDVFGEELESAPYSRCERIAAVLLVVASRSEV